MAIATYVARTSAKAMLEGRIQHHFTIKLEEIRADIRKGEEDLRSKLRIQETELSSLQGTLLGGLAQRQALLDKRRVEAVETVWKTVGSLAPLKGLARMTINIDMEKAANLSKSDVKIRSFFEQIVKIAEVYGKPNLPLAPTHAQLFISPLAWAYYSAYSGICAYYYASAKVITFGAYEIMDEKPIRQLVLAVIPEAQAHVEKFGSSSYYLWLDRFEELLLVELKRNIEDASLTERQAEQAKKYCLQ